MFCSGSKGLDKFGSDHRDSHFKYAYRKCITSLIVAGFIFQNGQFGLARVYCFNNITVDVIIILWELSESTRKMTQKVKIIDIV